MNWVEQTGLKFWTGVPCSFLARQWDCAFAMPGQTSVLAAQEGDAVAMACGAWLGGSPGAVLMQSSGLGNAVNPLTSLALPFRIPLLLVVSLRCDEPQHELMGGLTPDLLSGMGIETADFPGDPGVLRACLEERRPYALLLRDGKKGRSELRWSARPAGKARCQPVAPAATRREVLASVVDESSLFIATTGYTGRDLFTLGDRPNFFPMVGSMGCALSLGLGLALVQPSRRVVVLDGDGALLMRLGSLAACGHYRPANLTHVLLDNATHASTGGQPTFSGSVDFCALAAACGYERVYRTSAPGRALLQEPGPLFIHVPILAADEVSPRPTLPPPELADRFHAFAVNGDGETAG